MAAVVVAAGQVACVAPAHTYDRSRELAYLEWENGIMRMHRCSQPTTINSGFFIRGFDEAFPPGSEAAEYARNAERHSEVAFALGMVTVAMSIVAVALVFSADYDQTFSNEVPSETWAALGVASAALVPGFIGAAQAASAQTRTFDAVNAYNEATFADPTTACADIGDRDDGGSDFDSATPGSDVR